MHTIKEQIKEYLEHLKQRNLAKETIKGYRYWLNHLDYFLSSKKAKSSADIDRELIEEYVRRLYTKKKPNGEGLSNGVIAHYIGSLKNFFHWLLVCNHIIFNPASEIKYPPKAKSLPKSILTKAELARLLNNVDLNNIFGLRNKAILELLYSTGIRRSELFNLEICDLDRERGVLFIHNGKGGKDRVISISERAIYWIDKYTQEARERFLRVYSNPNLLFLDRHGKRLGPHSLECVEKRFLGI